MPQNFYPCDRQQQMLLPPSIEEWISEDHLAHFIVDCVENFDLSGFYSRFREDGRGQTAYEPSMLLTLLLYSYAIGLRSSRRIERARREQVPMRFITANSFPDHCTIARFRKKFRDLIENIFVQTLSLCDKAELVKLGAVAIDGTKILANAARSANFKQEHFQKLVKDILQEAEDIDSEEDEKLGSDKNGGEPPDWMKDPVKRRAKTKALKEKMDRAEKAADKVDERLQNAQDAYEEKMRAYERNKAEGKPLHRVNRTLLKRERMTVNGTDPDSRVQTTGNGVLMQGYNSQIAVDGDSQVILSADVVDEVNDSQMLSPMLSLTINMLQEAGISASRIRSVITDAGYWGRPALDKALDVLDRFSLKNSMDLLVAVPPSKQKLPCVKAPPGPEADIYVQHEYKQRCEAGQKIYEKRSRSIEAVFGQIKNVREIGRFLQRGMENVKSEWNLICTTHNLLKLWRHGKSPL